MERVGPMFEANIRIRGKVGQIEDPHEMKGKWCFELSLWTLDGEEQVGKPFTHGPFETEKLAHEEMQRAVRIACEAIEKAAGGKPTGKYFDLKAGGVMRPWEPQA